MAAATESNSGAPGQAERFACRVYDREVPFDEQRAVVAGRDFCVGHDVWSPSILFVLSVLSVTRVEGLLFAAALARRLWRFRRIAPSDGPEKSAGKNACTTIRHRLKACAT
jgi:hypothetical protein